MLSIGNHLFQKLSWHGLHLKAQEIFNLSSHNPNSYPQGKTKCDGFGNELDQVTKTQEPHDNKHESRHERGKGQTSHTILGDDAIDDNNECCSRSTNLNPTTS